MKIIFAGTPEFSVPALEALLSAGHDIIAVFTQPDRPVGRGRKLTPGPVKQAALQHGIPVFQPTTLKDADTQQQLRDLQADIMIVVAYGLLLPAAVLDIPRHGCLNIHASLLPRWRGAAPIQRAIEAGDDKTGITIMQMDAGLDTGDMLLVRELDIQPDETAGQLHDRLAEAGAGAIVDALSALQQGQLQPTPQLDDQATYARKLNKAESRIDWQRPAPELARKVRALNPWPVAQALWHDLVLRIWQAEALDTNSGQVPGTVVATAKQGIDVACGDGVLRLQTVQIPGGKPIAAAAFLNAHPMDNETLE